MSALIRSLARLFTTGAQPASTAEGDLWYRSDVDQLHASDGNAGIPLTVGPSGANVPVVRSTAWHTLPPYGNASTANVPDGRMFALPFWPGRRCTITAMTVNVTLALAGGNIRMGIYESSGVLPTTRLADFGVVSSGILGLRTISGLSQVVRPVLHFIVVGRQGGVLNLGLSSRDTWDPIVSETGTAVLNANRSAYYITGVGGALPASFGAPAGTDQAPGVGVQLT